MSELHDDLERARTALKKERKTDELVVACEHILCRPDLPISTPDVHLPQLDNAGTAHISRYRTTKRLKDLERRQEIVEQGPFGSPERFSYLSVESQLGWPALPHERILLYRFLLESLMQGESYSV